MGRRLLLFILALSACKSGSNTPSPSGRWMSGITSGGTIVQTFDHVSFTVRPVADHALRAVTCDGNTIGWTAGDDGLLLRTDDAGQHWTPEASGMSGAIRALRFDGGALGVAAGDGGALLVSLDGYRWQAVASGTTRTLRGVAVAASPGVVVAVGDGGTILRSSDGGQHFAAGTIAGAADLRAVATDPFARLLIAVDSAGNIFESDDGKLWFYGEAVAPAPLNAVAIAEGGQRAIAVGDRGTVMERAADGTWTPSQVGSANLHAAIITLDDTTDYVAGQDGTLARSTTAGARWETLPLDTHDDILGLDDL